MTTLAILVEENRTLDLACLNDDDYQLIASMHGQIRQEDPPRLLCLAVADPTNASLYIYQHERGRYYARHFPGHGHGGDHLVAKMSDEHRCQTEYFERAGDDAGHPTQREYVTTRRTRIDLLIEGPSPMGVEVQRSQLTRPAAKTRTSNAAQAGITSFWFHDKEAQPRWAFYVPTLGTTLKTDWKALPPRRAAYATGLRKLMIKKCRPGEFGRCPAGNTTFCNGWHDDLSDVWGGMTIDDVAEQAPLGLIVPAQLGRTDRCVLISNDDMNRLVEFKGPAAQPYRPHRPPSRTAWEANGETRPCLNVHAEEYDPAAASRGKTAQLGWGPIDRPNCIECGQPFLPVVGRSDRCAKCAILGRIGT